MNALPFVGRHEYLGVLDDELARVRDTGAARFVSMRGRRQVGKSTLVTEWLRRTEAPAVYFHATRRSIARELERFTEAAATSSLPTLPDVIRGGTRFDTWEAALRAVGATASSGPVVVVLDELPYLTQSDEGFEATLQAVWGQHLQHLPLVLIVIGSDLAMMEALSDHDRPLYGRIDRHIRVEPLAIVEVAQLRGVTARQAFDSYLVTGGFPKVVQSWPSGTPFAEFVQRATSDASEPLVLTAERMVNAELPGDVNARAVLLAIGSGESTFTNIARISEVGGNTLTRALGLLIAKRIVRSVTPLSVERRPHNTRYLVEDPLLRFWLRFIGPRIDDIERGRGDLVADSILGQWNDYRGTAIEPLVRDAVERLLPDPRFGDARHVGSYWTRTNTPQLDLTGTDHGPGKATHLAFAGSIKWRARRPFDRDDVATLERDAAQVPGFDGHTSLVGVSRTGFRDDVALDAMLTPADLLRSGHSDTE